MAFEKDIRNSILYNNIVSKFNVDFVNGKKENVRFPKQWQKINLDLTTDNSKNIAILTGKVNQIIVIDIDKPKNGEIDGLKYFEENVCELDKLDTIITKTYNGGYHIYFKYTEKLKNCVRLKDIQEVSIDIKSDGGCVYEGMYYQLLKDANELMNIPDEFIKLFTKENKRIKYENEYCGNYDESTIQLILNNLNNNYYDNYQDWFNVLCVLKNLEIEKEIAINFSKRSNKFELETFNKTWNAIEKRETPRFGTLIYFLKQSVGKVKFDNLIKKIKNLEQKKDENKTFLEICKIFYNLYKNEIFVEIKVEESQNNIYVINKYGIWKKIKKDSKYFLNKIRQFVKYLKLQNIYYDLNEPCKYNVFLNEVLKEFQIEESSLQWNCNPYLFAFNNGVYDLKTMQFRSGYYDEFINITCGYNYVYEDSLRAKLFYEDFLICPIAREYYLNIVASHLVDIHQREEFIVKYNKLGQNGKSKENQLLAYVFGNYAYTCKSSILICNNNENPEGAAPVLLSMKNKRMILFNEIKQGKTLDSETIKRLTGGDIINARDLYQAGTEQFYIKGCNMMCCNEFPAFDRIDSATIRRMVFIPCETRFVVNPIKANERAMKQIKTDELKHSMFQLLLEHFKNEVPKEFDTRPKFVKEAVYKYLSYTDNIKRFIRDFIEKSEDDYIKRSELKDLFKDMSNKTEYKLKGMNYDKFEEYIIDELQTDIKEKHDNGQRNCIIGYKIKDSN